MVPAESDVYVTIATSAIAIDTASLCEYTYELGGEAGYVKITSVRVNAICEERAGDET